MDIGRTLKAGLLGLSMGVSSLAIGYISTAEANTVRVVKRGATSVLNVPVNRAVIVESDAPFAEIAIANPNIADASGLSDRSIYVLGQQPGVTTLTLLDGTGQLITNVEVRVSADVSEFKERLRQILPGEEIEVRTANDGIVLSGVVSSMARLQRALDLAERYAPERVSNMMVVGGIQQVMMKVRFAEMQRSVSKSLNSSWAVGGQANSGRLNVDGITGSITSSGQSAATASANNAGAILFGFNVNSLQFGLLLEALEQKGMVRTLAEPNLVALSGQEASFLAGGEYPIPIVQEEGNVTVEFRPFGVELNFIPRVVDQDIINLELEASVSSLDTTNTVTTNGFTVNSFATRSTTTTVELRDGESFAVAGLLRDEFTDSATQLPWIGDVPVLGALFRSSSYQRSQTELVIIVTAHLVTPTRGEALLLPTDRITLPTEGDLFLRGQVSGRSNVPTTGAAGEVARQNFTGSYGYVLD